MDLRRRVCRTDQELGESLGRSGKVETDERSDEQAKALCFLSRLGDLVRTTCSAVDQHLLERAQVLWGELLVATQLLKGDIALVLAQVDPSLGPETLVVGPDRSEEH